MYFADPQMMDRWSWKTISTVSGLSVAHQLPFQITITSSRLEEAWMDGCIGCIGCMEEVGLKKSRHDMSPPRPTWAMSIHQPKKLETGLCQVLPGRNWYRISFGCSEGCRAELVRVVCNSLMLALTRLATSLLHNYRIQARLLSRRGKHVRF